MTKQQIQNKLKEAGELIFVLKYASENNPGFPLKEDIEMMNKVKLLIAGVLLIPDEVMNSPGCHCITYLAMDRCKHYRAHQCCKSEDLLKTN